MKVIKLLLLAVVLCCRGFAQSNDTTSHQLKEIKVTAKSQVVKQEGDKIIYDLQADPQSQANSLLDMMRKVPHLSVNGAEHLLLNGSTTYKIFINGRPSGMLNGSPSEVLRSIPASTVKSIEVIINPPAKYDAEGLAGIINIVTIKQKHNGYKGSVNLNGKIPAGGPGAGANFTIKQGRTGISSIAGTNIYDIPETNEEQQRTGSLSANMEQHNVSRNHGRTLYGGTECSYEIDSLNLVSAQINGHHHTSAMLSQQTTTLTNSGNYQYYKLDNNSGNMNNSLEGIINYQRGFRNNKEHLLTTSYQFSKETTQTDCDITFSQKMNYATSDYRQGNSKSITLHTVQADYVRPLGKLSAEGGIKGIFTINNSNFQHENMITSTGIYEMDTLQSNTLTNRQHVWAIYNSYNYTFTNWQLKVGIRAEKTIVNNQGIATIRYQYINWLPSLAINRQLKSNSSISFSFSGRIQRPSAAELNPFINRSNPAIISSGNPYLRPITSKVVELSYLKSTKATLHVSLGGMFFDNVFNAITTYDTVANISLTTYENYGRGQVLKTNISLNYPITNNWTFTMNTDIRHVAVHGIADNGRSFKNSGIDVYVYASGSYQCSNGWRINAGVTFKKGGILLPRGRINGFIASSVSLNKNLLQSKLTIAATVINPFSEYRYIDETMEGSNFLQTSHKQVYFRRFTISLNYRFGKLEENIKKATRGIDNGSN